MQRFRIVLFLSLLIPCSLYGQASQAQARLNNQSARRSELDSLGNLATPDASSSVPWQSLSAEQADDPTTPATLVKQPIPREARKAAERAEHLSGKNRHEEAAAEFRAALAIYPQYYEAANNLALELEALGQAAEAEKMLRDLTRSAPAHILAFGNLAALLSLQKRYVEAEAVCREALKLHPYSLRASFFLGTSLINQGKWSAEAKRNLDYAQLRYGQASMILKKWPGPGQ
jgi:tetratricopeptide (TPR) repeat protein